jgi:hypothetical protein
MTFGLEVGSVGRDINMHKEVFFFVTALSAVCRAPIEIDDAPALLSQ